MIRKATKISCTALVRISQRSIVSSASICEFQNWTRFGATGPLATVFMGIHKKSLLELFLETQQYIPNEIKL